MSAFASLVYCFLSSSTSPLLIKLSNQDFSCVCSSFSLLFGGRRCEQTAVQLPTRVNPQLCHGQTMRAHTSLGMKV